MTLSPPVAAPLPMHDAPSGRQQVWSRSFLGLKAEATLASAACPAGEHDVSDLRSKAASLISGRKGAYPQRDDSAGTRYSDGLIEFRHEFTLGASGDVYPPGPYAIEIAEDSYTAAGHTAHVRKSTWLIVPTVSGTRAIPIDVRELEAALKKDAEREQLDAPGESPNPNNAENARLESVQSQLERYGIERVPADVFVWGRYRYTNASDAIAAAKRAERR
jgi:hypothetical protein